jgi:hypothetical protein
MTRLSEESVGAHEESPTCARLELPTRKTVVASGQEVQVARYHPRCRRASSLYPACEVSAGSADGIEYGGRYPALRQVQSLEGGTMPYEGMPFESNDCHCHG